MCDFQRPVRNGEPTAGKNELENTDGFHPSSEDNANWISRVLFSFVGFYWWRTRKATTDAELLEKPSKRITAERAAKKLQNAWNKNGPLNGNFLLALWRSTRVPVILLAFLLCFEEVLRVAQPLLLRELMSYYDIKEGKKFEYMTAMFVAGFISFLSFLTVIIHHPYFHGLLNIGNHTRVGTGVLLYKKALRLSLTSLMETNSGQLIQLLNTDAAKLEQAFLFLHYVWLCPLLMVFYAFILWYSFGASCLVGFVVMMCIVTFQVYFSYQLGVNRRNIADKMDLRLKVMSEIIKGMKVIKMHGWEKAFADKITVLREEEIKAVGKSSFYSSMVMGIYFISAKIGLLVYIFACSHYDEDLTTKGVFAASALYNTVRLPFALFLPLGLLLGRELISTSRRINHFFCLGEFSRATVAMIREAEALETHPSWLLDDRKTERATIQMNNVTSVWYDKTEKEEKKQLEEKNALNGSLDEKGVYEKKEHIIYAVEDMDIEFVGGECYGIIGSVGSGKSSLLLTILSEARMKKGNLEVHGSIAYCAQEPWIFTGTVQQNILFGKEFDADRYETALDLCLLKPDMMQLGNGDLTVVGDNGSTLSGGQRARVALARAVYADADIYLLDDPLSAVDTHVGRKLYENLIRGFLSDKLVILVTHQIHFLNSLNSVILMKNNKMIASGTLEDLRSAFSEEFINLQPATSSPEECDELYKHGAPSSPPPSPLERKASQKRVNENVPAGRPTEGTNLEVRKSGDISWSVYWEYTKGVLDPWKLGVLLVICVLFTQLLNNFVDWWLNKWLVDLDRWNANNSTTKGTFSRDVDVFGHRFKLTFKTYEVTFVVSTIIITFFGIFRAVWFRYAQLSASRSLHISMFNCVLNTQSEFFDRNSEGMILNRFSKDIGLTDDNLAFTYFEFVFGGLTFLGIVGLVTMVRPVVIFACAFTTFGFYYCRRTYVVRSRELKRIEAKARSPLNTLITSTIHGLATIRAFRKENDMIEKFCSLHDVYMSAYNMGILSARWFGICIDFLVSVFVSAVAIVVVLEYETLTVGEVGLCLVCAVQLSGFFSWIMRQSAELENGMVSVERMLEYTKLKSEEDMRRPHDKYLDDVLQKSWPSKGQIEFENVRVKYGDIYVLNNLNFVILQGQKIGIVGRTGAGKSTLIKILFGLKEYCAGQVKIDDVDLDSISLKFRRTGMSIIPQEPVLFSGTIRENLDPFNQYDDATIWFALEQCELKRAITRDKGLNVELGQQGVSLSVGQRQLFCLARAMIHRAKILVIDEATANVDGVTDACIQRTIRSFFKDATIITVAHRLHTIMNSDMIMVFEKGELVEFDKPTTLLNDPSTRFAKMAAQSGAENMESLKTAADAYALDDQKRSFDKD
uniref:Channel conductance-controlling ATPase n=1 Tax=Caenorhabditis tropicalis TaxID=1561998 RepID=A0A1I7UQC4_9PELO